MSKLIKGIAASDGVAIAKAYFVEPDLSYDSNEKVTDIESELKSLMTLSKLQKSN